MNPPAPKTNAVRWPGSGPVDSLLVGLAPCSRLAELNLDSPFHLPELEQKGLLLARNGQSPDRQKVGHCCGLR
jgi:hypothetical protein